MVRPERLLGAARLVPSGPPSLRSGVQLGLRPSCRTRLVFCRSSNYDVEPTATTRGSQARNSIGAPGGIRTPGLLVRRERLDGPQVDDFQLKSAREVSNISAGYIAVGGCLLWAATLGIRRERPSIKNAALGPDCRITSRGGERRPGYGWSPASRRLARADWPQADPLKPVTYAAV